MTTKHTPGPWVVVDPEANGNTCVQSAVSHSNGGFVTASCPGDDQVANARLIAAAPNLLFFAEQFLFAVDVGNVSFKDFDVRNNAIRMGSAAVAKATGGA